MCLLRPWAGGWGQIEAASLDLVLGFHVTARKATARLCNSALNMDKLFLKNLFFIVLARTDLKVCTDSAASTRKRASLLKSKLSHISMPVNGEAHVLPSSLCSQMMFLEEEVLTARLASWTKIILNRVLGGKWRCNIRKKCFFDARCFNVVGTLSHVIPLDQHHQLPGSFKRLLEKGCLD